MKYVSDSRLRDDDQIAAWACENDGRSLEYVSARLKSDRTVVLAACNSCYDALKFACQELKEDNEVILAAMRSAERATAKSLAPS